MSNAKGRFGIHGGQYIPETLMNAVIELEEAYNPDEELDALYRQAIESMAPTSWKCT